MSNYTKATNFATKDALPTGNALKIVSGTEIDTEFSNIETAVNTKADTSVMNAADALKANIASPTFTGVPAAPTATAGTNTTQVATTAFAKAAADTKLPKSGGAMTAGAIITNFASTGIDDNATSTAITIESAGNVLVGTTSNSVQNARQYIVHTAANAGIQIQPDALSSGSAYVFFNNEAGGVIGGITRSGTSSAVQYLTSSDYRLKELDVPMTGATERVKELRPVNFAWKVDGKRVDGFYAHELAEVVPEAASGTKDAMRDEEYEVTPATGDVFTAGSEAGFTEVSAAVQAEPAYYDVDGNVIKAEVIAQSAVHEAYEAIAGVTHSADVEQPETLEEGQQWRETTAAVMGTRSVPDMQGIDQSKLVPLLTATIQELIARIETLEAGE